MEMSAAAVECDFPSKQYTCYCSRERKIVRTGLRDSSRSWTTCILSGSYFLPSSSPCWWGLVAESFCFQISLTGLRRYQILRKNNNQERPLNTCVQHSKNRLKESIKYSVHKNVCAWFVNIVNKELVFVTCLKSFVVERFTFDVSW